MERLTNSIEYCKMHCDFGKGSECFFDDESKCYERSIYDKLREYEMMEEQGLLLRLPCPIGTDVYYILGIPRKTPCVIESTKFDLMDIKRIGVNMWITPEEAEEALEKMKGEEHDTGKSR